MPCTPRCGLTKTISDFFLGLQLFSNGKSARCNLVGSHRISTLKLVKRHDKILFIRSALRKKMKETLKETEPRYGAVSGSKSLYVRFMERSLV